MPYKDDEAQATEVDRATEMPALGEFPPAHDSVKLFLVVHYHSTPEEALKLLSNSTTELPLGQHFRTRQGHPLLPEGSFLHKTGKFRFHVKSFSLATMYPLISTTRMRYPHLRRLGIVILSEETLSVPQVSYLVAILKHYGAQINELSLWIKAGLAQDGPHGENLVSTLDPLWAQLNSQANQLGSLVLDIQLHPPVGFEYRKKQQQKVYPINLSALLPKLSRFKFGSANNSCNVDESLRALMDTPKALKVEKGKKKVKGEVKSEVKSEVKDKSDSGSKSKSSEQKDSKDNKSGEDKPKQKKTGKKKKPRKRKKKTKKKKRVNPQAHGYQYAQPLPEGAQPGKIANRVFCAKLNQIAIRVKSAKADELTDYVNAFSNLQLLTVFVDNPQVTDEIILQQIGSYYEDKLDDSKSQSKSLEKQAPPKLAHLISLRLHLPVKYRRPDFSFDPVNPKDGTILSIRHLYSLTIGLFNKELFGTHKSFKMNSLRLAFPNLQGLVLLVNGPVPQCHLCGPNGIRKHLALLLGNLDQTVPFEIKSLKVVRVDFLDSGSSFEITRTDVAELYPNLYPPEIPKIVTKKATKRSKGKKPKAVAKPAGSQIDDGTKPDSTIGCAIDSNANSDLSQADTYAISTVDDKAEKSGKSSQEKSDKDSSNSDSKQKDKKKEKEKSSSEKAELTSSEMKKRKKRAAKKAKAKDPYDDLEADYLANLFGNEDDEDNDDEEEEEEEQSSEYESEDIATDGSVVEDKDGSAVEKSDGIDQDDDEEVNDGDEKEEDLGEDDEDEEEEDD